MSPLTIKIDDSTRELTEKAAKQRGVSLGEYIRTEIRVSAARDVEACAQCGRAHKKRAA